MEVEDPDVLDLCTIVWAVTTYVIANLEEKLPRSGEAEFMTTMSSTYSAELMTTKSQTPSAAPSGHIHLTLLMTTLLLAVSVVRKR